MFPGGTASAMTNPATVPIQPAAVPLVSQAASPPAPVVVTAVPGVTQVGTPCTQNGLYQCGGPKNAAGQDSINICSGGTWVKVKMSKLRFISSSHLKSTKFKVDDCDENPACGYSGGIPFCVEPGTAGFKFP